MSKPNPSRRDRIEQIRNEQKSSDRRRTGLVVGGAVLLGLLMIGAAAAKPISDWWGMRGYESMALSEIGAEASVCDDVVTKPASGSQDHVPVGTPLEYEDAPPAFGQHYERWDSMERKFYSSDRPDLGLLVHNLEHGFTILWYDETVAADDEQVEEIRAIASKFDDDDNLRNKFKAVPWTSEDGDPFPDGQHVALTHWSVGGAGSTDGEQTGVWQYCSQASGAALEQFMQDYPYMDSPEPNAV